MTIHLWTITTILGFGLSAQIQTGFIQQDVTGLNGTSGVSGTIGGAPAATLAKVRVTAYRTNPVSPLAIASVSTAQDGTFTLVALPAGTYKICLATDGDFVDPCRWGLTSPSVTLAAGQRMTGGKYNLTEGSRAKFKLVDGAGNLQQKPGEAGPQHVLVGVLNPNGTLTPMTAVASSATSVDHELVIPNDTALKLVVYSKGVALEDETHKAVGAQGLVRDFTKPSAAAQAPAFIFYVTGRR